MSTNTFFKKVLFDKRINDKIKKIEYKIVADIRESIVTRKYIRRCKSCFPVYGREERRFLKRLRQQIEDYVQNNEGLSYEQLEEAFGSPIDVVNEYFESVEEESLLTKRITFSKYVRKTIVAILVIIMIFFACEQFIYYKAYKDNQNLKVVPATNSEYIIKEK